jgi:peroxiredoxin
VQSPGREPGLLSRLPQKILMPLSHARALVGLFTMALAFVAAAAVVPDDPSKVVPLALGTTIPTVAVRDADGSERRLGPQTITQPTVLIFYRGGWCPYCNTHLGELRHAEGPLLELGYELLFLSADRPELLYSSLKEPGIRYTLLSDARMDAARAFGIAFRVDDATVAKYKAFGIDLEATSGEAHHQLPVPAVFIVDRRGIVQFAYANPDYKVRLSSEDLLSEARRVAGLPPAK